MDLPPLAPDFPAYRHILAVLSCLRAFALLVLLLLSDSFWSPPLRGPSLVLGKQLPPEFCFYSNPSGCISSLPAPALTPGMHLPQHVCPVETGVQWRRLPGPCGTSGVISQAGCMLDSCPSFVLHLPTLCPPSRAGCVRGAGRVLGQGSAYGAESTASGSWPGCGCGHSLAPRRSLPINKRFLSSSQLCAAAACLLARPFVPTRCHGDSDSKAWYFKASFLSCGLGLGQG